MDSTKRQEAARLDAFLGQQHPLAEQLESRGELASLSAVSSEMTEVPASDEKGLRAFLLRYREDVLLPFELPAIARAFEHAGRHETRELIAYDRSLDSLAPLAPLATASRRFGREQLARLRPLRDQRVVQRYLAAVELGDAHGWHTLVYGVTLAVYSLPLRQGLNAYALRALEGFLKADSSPLRQDETRANQELAELAAPIPAAIESLLSEAVVAAAKA